MKRIRTRRLRETKSRMERESCVLALESGRRAIAGTTKPSVSGASDTRMNSE